MKVIPNLDILAKSTSFQIKKYKVAEMTATMKTLIPKDCIEARMMLIISATISHYYKRRFSMKATRAEPSPAMAKMFHINEYGV